MGICYNLELFLNGATYYLQRYYIADDLNQHWYIVFADTHKMMNDIIILMYIYLHIYILYNLHTYLPKYEHICQLKFYANFTINYTCNIKGQIFFYS